VWRAVRGDLTVERLRAAGVRAGARVAVERGAWVDLEWGYLIELGDRVVLAPGAMVLAHDASMQHWTGHTRIAPVSVGDRVFVGARAVVLPGVTIGSDVVIAAGSVVTHDIAPECVVGGVPARRLCSLDEFRARYDEARAAGATVSTEDRVRAARGDAGARQRVNDVVRPSGEAWVPAGWLATGD
jgi:maltose O-acetyltransferase